VKTVSGPKAASAWCAGRKRSDSPLVLVPTMGALHDGHAGLIRKARKAAGPQGTVVVSVFVNPTQFGSGEDFEKYPRTLKADQALCRREGADLFFMPESGKIYAPDRSVLIREADLSSGLCGASRPGHFDGVCTVVSILFHIIRPDMAVFGEKDWQQLAVIRRMVRDLHFPVKILPVPTVRERDGLARSSRNRLLTPAARQAAPGLYRALRRVATSVSAGERSVARLKASLKRDLLAISGADIDYAEIVSADSLDPLVKLSPGMIARVLVAVRFGSVRLIDNIPLALTR
jgi:pantoate--beta-alanine ligase